MDLRPSDATRARDIYAGHFHLDHQSVVFGPDGPFADHAACASLRPQARADLHAFVWLPDLAAAATPVSRANALALLEEWSTLWGRRFEPLIWRGDVAARRLIILLSHLPSLLDGPPRADGSTDRNYDRLRPVLARMLARHARILSQNANVHRNGLPRLTAHIAVLLYNLCIVGKDRSLERAAHGLDRELRRQIALDGGHVSRNPAVLLEVLSDLYITRQAFIRRGVAPTQTLISTIDRMAGALRMLRHSNGTVARFNGRATVDEAWLSQVLRYDPPAAELPLVMPQSGYDRLSGERTVVLVDSGRIEDPRDGRNAMAGTLSFEMSSGDHVFVSNCGQPDVDVTRTAPFARMTAAHSTATIGHQSSSLFLEPADRWLSRLVPPIVAAPPNVGRTRSDDGTASVVQLHHDGYAERCGLVHHRMLSLTKTGGAFDGSDRFEATGETDRRDDTDAAIRFHLAPGLSVSRLSSGHSILIAANGGDAWTFTCVDVAPQLAESIRFDGEGGSKRCEQIVLHVPAPLAEREVRWTLRRTTGTIKMSSRAFRRGTQAARGGIAKKERPTGDLLTPLQPATSDTDGVK